MRMNANKYDQLFYTFSHILYKKNLSIYFR